MLFSSFNDQQGWEHPCIQHTRSFPPLRRRPRGSRPPRERLRNPQQTFSTTIPLTFAKTRNAPTVAGREGSSPAKSGLSSAVKSHFPRSWRNLRVHGSDSRSRAPLSIRALRSANEADFQGSTLNFSQLLKIDRNLSFAEPPSRAPGPG